MERRATAGHLNASRIRRHKVSESGITLLQFLAETLNTSRKKAKSLIDKRGILVNGRRVWMARHVLSANDLVEIQSHAPSKTSGTVSILKEDEALVIVEKPPGILTNGKDSLELLLRHQSGNPKLEAVHRLDRDTSGCVVFAKNHRIKCRMVEIFHAGEVAKTYEAVVRGAFKRNSQTVSEPIDNRTARTRILRIRANKNWSHLRVAIETGRTHQIRKHLRSIGHPVVGDREYAGSRRLNDIEKSISRQMLHAALITFPHPIDNEPVRCRANLPHDFKHCLKLMGLEGKKSNGVAGK